MGFTSVVQWRQYPTQSTDFFSCHVFSLLVSILFLKGLLFYDVIIMLFFETCPPISFAQSPTASPPDPPPPRGTVWNHVFMVHCVCGYLRLKLPACFCRLWRSERSEKGESTPQTCQQERSRRLLSADPPTHHTNLQGHPCCSQLAVLCPLLCPMYERCNMDFIFYKYI